MNSLSIRVYDAEIQELLLREDHQNCSSAMNRALSLRAVVRNSCIRQRRRLASLRSFVANTVEIEKYTQSIEMMPRSTSSRVFATAKHSSHSCGFFNATQLFLSSKTRRVTERQQDKLKKAMRIVCRILIRPMAVLVSYLSIPDQTKRSTMVDQLKKIASVDD